MVGVQNKQLSPATINIGRVSCTANMRDVLSNHPPGVLITECCHRITVEYRDSQAASDLTRSRGCLSEVALQSTFW